MKKYFAIIALLSASHCFAFVQQPDLQPQQLEANIPKNQKVLQNWIHKNHIKGKTVTTEEEFKNLPNFPPQFLKYKVRIVKHNSPMTMDYAYDRITVALDKLGKISEVNFG